MSRVPAKRISARRKSASPVQRRCLPLPRRSSYLNPSAETLASLNEDFSKLPIYHTAEEFFKALDEESSK